MTETNTRTTYSLADITASIQRMVAQKWVQSYWIKAEMNKLNFYRNSGHCHPVFVEKKDGKVMAQMNGIIYSSDYTRIESEFRNVTGEELKDGISILFEARVTFHQVYGFALQVLNIDPAYTLGELEIEKQKTISTLKQEFLFNRNKELQLPLLVKRLAIISVDTSNGYQDFLKIINQNGKGFAISHQLFTSILQGEKAVAQILAQLRQIKMNAGSFDAVAIIRGGGGSVGLSCFNNLNLCKEICLFPIPVLTGIGHATNETVAEMVANRNGITPTDLANSILQSFHLFSSQLDRFERIISENAKQLLNTNTLSLRNVVRQLNRDVRHSIQLETDALSAYQKNLKRFSLNFVAAQRQQASDFSRHLKKDVISDVLKHRIELNNCNHTLRKATQSSLQNFRTSLKGYTNIIKRAAETNFREQAHDLAKLELRISAVDPQKALERGFTITTVNGKMVRKASEVREGDIIVTQTAENRIVSTVNKTL